MHVLVILLLTFNEAVGIETSCSLNCPEFGFREGHLVFLFPRMSRLTLGLTPPYIEWVLGSYPGIKREGCDVDHSPPSNPVIRNEWRCTCTAFNAFMAWRGQRYFLRLILLKDWLFGCRTPRSESIISVSKHLHCHVCNWWFTNCVCVCVCVCVYRVSQEERTKLREGVPYVKLYRYNPKHLCPKLNGYWDNGQINLWTSFGSTNDSCQLVKFIYTTRGFGANSADARLKCISLHMSGRQAGSQQAGWCHRSAFQCDV